MVYSGGEQHRTGVGLVMRNNIVRTMIGYWPISERVIMIKLKAIPLNANIFQVYARTQDYDDEEVESFIRKVKPE